MDDKVYKVGIIGCGEIFFREWEAVNLNENFELGALCDIRVDRLRELCETHGVPGYVDYKEMIATEDINFVVIATPNGLHVEQTIWCLESGVDVLVEKPVSLDSSDIERIQKAAAANNQRAYAVLQVRLNPVIQGVKKFLESPVAGTVRGVSLVQRWCRPLGYFKGWRADPEVGGSILHEAGIHYLDILCYVFGRPSVTAAQAYSTKHNVGIEDTIYALVDYENFGGTVEVTIAAEPSNLECSMSIMTDRAYIKIGGRAMNKIKETSFKGEDTEAHYEAIMQDIEPCKIPNTYTNSYEGSIPNHPELLARLDQFDISCSYDVLALIEEMHDACNIAYKYKRERKEAV